MADEGSDGSEGLPEPERAADDHFLLDRIDALPRAAGRVP